MNGRFHHIGLACRDLDAEARWFSVMGYVQESDDFMDPIQGICGRFLVDGGPRLELLKPFGSRNVLEPWLKSGVKMYHLAYEVGDLDAEIESLRAEKAKLVLSPVPAVAFAGRKIAFMMLPNMSLIELISEG